MLPGEINSFKKKILEVTVLLGSDFCQMAASNSPIGRI